MKLEKKELQKAVEQLGKSRDYFDQQIWEKEMQYAKKYEEVGEIHKSYSIWSLIFLFQIGGCNFCWNCRLNLFQSILGHVFGLVKIFHKSEKPVGHALPSVSYKKLVGRTVGQKFESRRGSDYVTNSYGESWDSSCEKSWVPVHNQWVLNWKCLGLYGDRRQNSLLQFTGIKI